MILQALAQFESDLCECGHPRSESMDPAHDAKDPAHVARYQAGAPFICLACAELARAQEQWSKSYGDDGLKGAKWVAELVPKGLRLASPG